MKRWMWSLVALIATDLGCSSVLPYEPQGVNRPSGQPVVWRPPQEPAGEPPIASLPDVPKPIDPGPIYDPNPQPPVPKGDPFVQWSPWPLAPRGTVMNQSTAAVPLPQRKGDALAKTGRGRRPMNVAARHGSRAHRHYRRQSGLPMDDPRTAQLVEGAAPRQSEDLRYHGGKILPDLSYANLYVAGDTAWDRATVDMIDAKLAAAMNDAHLNNVIRQYFNNAPITSTAQASHPLIGYRPSVVSRGDVAMCLQYLYQQGYLSQFDANITCFNFILPSGTFLNDNDGTSSYAVANPKTAEEVEKPSAVPSGEEADSRGGLGGYHGSIHVGGKTLYYSVIVFSEQLPNGTANGIPVFPEPWKNIVATLYHELQEVRTDPDVEDAIRLGANPQSVRYLGWTSDNGEEIGDFPLHDGVPITSIVREVPLADGSGTVPIQLQFSNAVHGPEGPIAQLHPPAVR